MKHTAAFMLLCAFLMGCDAASNPFNTEVVVDDTTDDGTDGGDDTGGLDGPGGTGNTTVDTTVNVPAAIAGNVTSVAFNATSGTLTVTGVNLDNVPVSTTYARTPSLDQDGFLAYTSQDDPLDRHFTALVASGTNVRAAAVSSPSPRNRTFKGAFFERDGAYDPPVVTEDSGLVTYAGTYVGLTNISDPSPQNLLSTTVTPEELQPGQALLTDGDVVLNADFADNQVEGNIINRRLLGSDGTQYFELPSLVLIVAPIDANGTFGGNIEYDVGDPRSATTGFVQVGTYAGLFAGIDSPEVAGAVELSQFDGSGNPLGLENELESGAFILQACTAASADPICSQIP